MYVLAHGDPLVALPATTDRNTLHLSCMDGSGECFTLLAGLGTDIDNWHSHSMILHGYALQSESSSDSG